MLKLVLVRFNLISNCCPFYIPYYSKSISKLILAFVHKYNERRYKFSELQFFWKATIQKKAMQRKTIPLTTRTNKQRFQSPMSYPFCTSEPHRVISQTPEYLQDEWKSEISSMHNCLTQRKMTFLHNI